MAFTVPDSPLSQTVIRASDRVRWIVDVLSRRRLVILLAILLGVGAAAIRCALFQDPIYRSMAILKAEWSPHRTDARNYETCFLIFDIDKVYGNAAVSLGLPEKWKLPVEVCGRQLVHSVKIMVMGRTHLILVDAVAPSRELARSYCRAVVDAYVAERLAYHSLSAMDRDTEVERIYRELLREATYYRDLLEERNRLFAQLSVEETKAMPQTLAFLGWTMDKARKRAKVAQGLFEIFRSIPHEVRLNLPMALDFRHLEGEKPFARLMEVWSLMEVGGAVYLTEEHPAMKALMARRMKAEEMLEEEGDRVVKRAFLEAQLSAREAEVFEGQFLEAVQLFEQLNEGRFRLDMLRGILSTQSEALQTYHERFMEAEIQKEIPIVSLEEISPPSDGRPLYRPVWQDLLLAVVVSFFFGLAIVLGVEWADSSMQVVDRLERDLHVKVIGSVPHHLFSRRRRSRSLYVESYRLLATNVRFALEDRTPAVVIVTSCGAKEGKSTTAANLGIVWSQLGKRVLLVDCDLVRPTVHKIFGCNRRPGLAEYLSASGPDHVDLPVQHHGGMDLVAGGRTQGSAALLLESGQLKRMLEDLRKRYDYVILDCVPLLGFSHVQNLAQWADGVLLLVESGRYSLHEGKEALRSLDRVGAKVLGVCLNKIDLDSPGRVYHGYYRYYGYDLYYHYASNPLDQVDTGLVQVKERPSSGHVDSRRR